MEMAFPYNEPPNPHESPIDAARGSLRDRQPSESENNPAPTLSVIIPTCNRRGVLTTRTLPALFAQEMPADKFEIIVVVDGSTDGTAEAVRTLKPPCPLRVMEQAKRGPGAARNSGIRMARGAIVLFIDDDIICEPDLFRLHVEAHAETAPAVVHGHISIAPDTPVSILRFATEAWYRDYYRTIDSQNGVRLPQDNFLISNSSMPRDVLVECGGFDETLTAKEDYELALRLSKSGLRFIYLRNARAYEFFLKSARSVLYSDGKGFGESDILLARKHPECRPFTVFAPLGKMTNWKRAVRRVLATLPVNPVSALSLPLRICDKLARFPRAQRAGQYLLGVGRNINEFRAGIRKAGSWNALDSEFGRTLPVLLYHHVGPEYPRSVPGLTISPERFERHVRWLAWRGYKGIRPSDWLRWCNEGKGLPAKSVLLTFDDGYEDLVEYAFPILEKYGFGAVVYIVTGQPGGLNTWDIAKGYAPLSLMTSGQIRHWAKHGIEFGAHTRTHADLTQLSRQELEAEVRGSVEDLEKLLGEPVVSFAYPFGYKTAPVEECVRKTCDVAFGIDPSEYGINHLLTDRHLLQRAMIHPEYTVIDIESCVRRGYSVLDPWRVKLRVRTRLKRLRRAVTGR